MTSKESFVNLDSWLKEVEKNSTENVNVLVIGNKADMEEDLEVTDAEIKKFEEDHSLKVMKASAKTGKNVDEAFLEMTKKLIVKKQ